MNSIRLCQEKETNKLKLGITQTWVLLGELSFLNLGLISKCLHVSHEHGIINWSVFAEEHQEPTHLGLYGGSVMFPNKGSSYNSGDRVLWKWNKGTT